MIKINFNKGVIAFAAVYALIMGYVSAVFFTTDYNLWAMPIGGRVIFFWNVVLALYSMGAALLDKDFNGNVSLIKTCIGTVGINLGMAFALYLLFAFFCASPDLTLDDANKTSALRLVIILVHGVLFGMLISNYDFDFGYARDKGEGQVNEN